MKSKCGWIPRLQKRSTLRLCSILAITTSFIIPSAFGTPALTGGIVSNALSESAADALWHELERLAGAEGMSDDNLQSLAISVSRLAASSLPKAHLDRLRELALEFYERFPSDSRTPFLRRALLKWDEKDAISPFFDAIRDVLIQKRRSTEGYWDFEKRTDKLFSSSSGVNVDSLDEARRLEVEFHQLRLAIRSTHPDPAAERAIYARIKKGRSPLLDELIAGRDRFLALRETPLNLALGLLAGDTVISLASLRGRVVLLDFWSLSCAGCITTMPRLQTFYEKYRRRGVEIVGVCLISQDDPEKQAAEKQRAIEVLNKQGATWPEAAMVGSQAISAFLRRYSLGGVPQIWLLDQQGRIVFELDSRNDLYGPRAGQSRLELAIEELLPTPAK